MNNFLQGYLTILPQFERKEVERIINDNIESYEVQVVNEKEFEELIKLIQEDLIKITKIVGQGDILDAERFNQFYSAVEIDLKRLFVQHNRTETIVANYDRILKGLLDDMYREYLNLKKKVEELDTKSNAEEGLIIFSYGFEEELRSEKIETNREEYLSLFRDRDSEGTVLPDATLIRDYHQQYLVLPQTNKVNVLKDESGKVTAKIAITNRHGNAIVNSLHPIGLAIDTAEETYWTESIVANGVIENATIKL